VSKGEREDAGDPPSNAHRADLEQRLGELHRQLEDLSRDRLRWPQGAPLHLQERSEELEGEADEIRKQLGLPAALGRPPRRSWPGWVVLVTAAALILWGVYQFAR